MTATTRTLALAAALAAAVAGIVLAAMAEGSGIPLMLLAAAIVVGLVFEPRYRAGRQLRDAALVDWRRSGERFDDPETGEALAVWLDPLTGARRYSTLGQDLAIEDATTRGG
jgi:hypothetical protein